MAQPGGKAIWLGYPKIVWDQCVFIFYWYAPNFLSTGCIGNTIIGGTLATKIQAAAGAM